jgi:small GTP-binding protein
MTAASKAPLLKKICMLGTYAVGKTSLVRRYVESIFNDRYLTTIGVKVDRKFVKVAGNELDLVLWDLSGDDELSQPRSSYFRGTSGYILVVDGCRRPTAQKAISILERAVDISGSAPVVVALNKADLNGEWEIGEAEIANLTGRGWPCFRTSAKTGENVDRLFQELAENMLQEVDDDAAK